MKGTSRWFMRFQRRRATGKGVSMVRERELFTRGWVSTFQRRHSTISKIHKRPSSRPTSTSFVVRQRIRRYFQRGTASRRRLSALSTLWTSRNIVLKNILGLSCALIASRSAGPEYDCFIIRSSSRTCETSVVLFFPSSISISYIILLPASKCRNFEPYPLMF